MTINESLSRYTGLAIRYTMLKTHYRSPIDWTSRDLEVARRVLQSWGQTLKNHNLRVEDGTADHVDADVVACLSDDLNTSEAIIDHLSRLHQSAKLGGEGVKVFQSTLRLLGFNRLENYRQFDISVAAYVPPDKQEVVDPLEDQIAQFRVLEANSLFSQSATVASRLSLSGIQIRSNELGGVTLQFYDKDDETEKARIQSMVESRLEARKAKNWAESDRIRDELAKMGIAIKDNKDGTTSWEVKR